MTALPITAEAVVNRELRQASFHLLELARPRQSREIVRAPVSFIRS
jgi:hypothetical protein